MKIIYLSISLLNLCSSILGLNLKQAFEIDSNSMEAEYNLYRVNILSDPNSAEEYLESYYYVPDDNRPSMIKPDDKGSCRLNKDKFIYHFNQLRNKHQVPLMVWNKELEEKSRDYLLELKNEHECKYEKLEHEKEDFDFLRFEGPKRLTELELLHKWYDPIYTLDNMSKDKDYFSTGIMLSTENFKVGCSKICCHLKEMYLCMLGPKVQDEGSVIEKIKPNKYLNDQS
jgi:hypothetical protein